MLPYRWWHHGAYGARLLAVNAALLLLGFWPAAAQARATVILVMGDSLSAGYDLSTGTGFAPRLEARLKGRGLDVRVIDGGVSGDTTAGGLARVDWMLGDHPDIAVVELGANDMLRGLDPAQTKANLLAIVQKLKKAQVRVILAGMKASPGLGEAYGQAYDAVFAAVAQAEGVTFYPFFLEGIAADPRYLLSDGLHPTPAGVERIVDGIAPVVAAEVGKVTAEAP